LASSRSGRPIRIFVGVPTMHERSGWICKHLAEWLTDLPYTVGDTYQYTIEFLHNFIPAASCRNHFCGQRKDLDPRPDWLLMIDNDMAPPMNLFDTIKDAPEDAMVVVPQFHMWDEPRAAARLCWGMDDAIAPPTDEHTKYFTLELDRFYPLTKCGTGAIFMKPELFDIIEKPYFWYTFNEDQGMTATEDINFSRKVVDSGLKIYGNPNISVGHYHNANIDVIAKRLVPRIDKEVKICSNGTIDPARPAELVRPTVGQ
jgi:hypothetical protein